MVRVEVAFARLEKGGRAGSPASLADVLVLDILLAWWKRLPETWN